MKLQYITDRYVADDSIAICAYEDGEPYGYVTVCLAGYGMTPPEGHIFIPVYKMTEEFLKQVMEDVVDEIVDIVPIGFGYGYLARLKEGWLS